MFWRVSTFTQLSPIEAILDKDALTLEELLDEEDLIQECKAANPRLSQFLSKRAIIEQLLKYLSETPEDDVHFKYSYTACEIFVCELDDVLLALTRDEGLMGQLFSLLDQPAPLNSTLAGYFGRVVGSLLVKRAGDMHAYLQRNSGILSKLVAHVDTTSTVEVLLRLVGADDPAGGAATGHSDWLADSDLMDQLLRRLVGPVPSTTRAAATQRAAQANIGHVLVAIAHSQASPMIEQLVRPEFLRRMLEEAIVPGSPVLRPVLSVCVALLDPKAPAVPPVTAPLGYGIMRSLEPPTEPDRSTVRAAAAEVVHYIARFSELLAPQPPPAGGAGRGAAAAAAPPLMAAPQTQEQPYGTLRPPLGRARLAVVDLGKALLSTADPLALRAVMATPFVQHALRLVSEYPFNSILHCAVLEILMLLLHALADENDCSCAPDGSSPIGGQPAPLAPIDEGADTSDSGDDGAGGNAYSSARGADSAPSIAGPSAAANGRAASPRSADDLGGGFKALREGGRDDEPANVGEGARDVASWLLDDVQLVDWLLGLNDDAKSPFFTPRTARAAPLPAAYRGHATQLAQLLNAVPDGLLRAALDLDGRWATFRDGPLAARTALEARDAWNVDLPAAAAGFGGDKGDGDGDIADDYAATGGSYPEAYDTGDEQAFGEPGDYFSSALGGGAGAGTGAASRYTDELIDYDYEEEEEVGGAGTSGTIGGGILAAGCLPSDSEPAPALASSLANADAGPRSYSLAGADGGCGSSGSSSDDDAALASAPQQPAVADGRSSSPAADVVTEEQEEEPGTGRGLAGALAAVSLSSPSEATTIEDEDDIVLLDEHAEGGSGFQGAATALDLRSPLLPMDTPSNDSVRSRPASMISSPSPDVGGGGVAVSPAPASPLRTRPHLSAALVTPPEEPGWAGGADDALTPHLVVPGDVAAAKVTDEHTVAEAYNGEHATWWKLPGAPVAHTELPPPPEGKTAVAGDCT